VTTDSPPELHLGEESRPWNLPDGAPGRFHPIELHLGKGSNPLEVAVARSDGRPPAGEVRNLWEKRHGRRASPLLCVALYHHNGTWRAAVCGPAGEDPRALLDLDIGQTARVCSAALAEPDRHAATRFLLETLPEDDADIPGLRNVGMFATHYLRSGVPHRSDWPIRLPPPVPEGWAFPPITNRITLSPDEPLPREDLRRLGEALIESARDLGQSELHGSRGKTWSGALQAVRRELEGQPLSSTDRSNRRRGRVYLDGAVDGVLNRDEPADWAYGRKLRTT